MKKLIGLLAAAMLVPSVAWGDEVKVEYTGFDNYETGTITEGGNTTGPGVVAGQYLNTYHAYKDAGGTEYQLNPAIDARTYCIDVVDAPATSPEWYQVEQLENAPITSETGSQAMGPQRAGHLKALWDLVGFDPAASSISPDQGAAFALAVWEIAWESTDTSYDLDSGNFSVSDYSTNVTNQASTWLGSVTSHTGSNDNLVALTNEQYQDFFLAELDTIIEEVPSPTAVAQLIGLGLVMGFIGYRRRRRQS